MKKALLVLVTLLATSTVYAFDFGIEFGVRSQSADVDSPASAKSQMGLQFGATTGLPINEMLSIRTGMLYTQRPLVVDSGGNEYKYTANYVDIPLQLLYRVEEYAGVYVGVSVAMNMDKNCSGVSGCTFESLKSPLVPLAFGAVFKFAPQIGGSIQFETASGEAAKGSTVGSLENYRAIGANLIVFFE